MTGRRPKLAEVSTLDEFSHWLAETIQEKASKENAGFIQIVRRVGRPVHQVSVTSHSKVFVLAITEEGE